MSNIGTDWAEMFEVGRSDLEIECVSSRSCANLPINLRGEKTTGLVSRLRELHNRLAAKCRNCENGSRSMVRKSIVHRSSIDDKFAG